MLLRLTLLAFLYASIQCAVYRLPKNVKPRKYHLTMEPDIHYTRDALPYNGTVTIDIDVSEDTKNITLHAVGISVDSGSVGSFRQEENAVTSITADSDDQTCTVHLERMLHQGENYNLTLHFHGELDQGGSGFFYSTYYDDEFRILAATQFEATHARRAFPCFDEPALKATFIVSLIREKSYNSVSNEELAYTEDLGNGKFKDTFKETPLMPIYTLAFAISQYKLMEKHNRIRIFGTGTDINGEKWKDPIDTAVKALDLLENYLEINYTLNKIDQIIIPDRDFQYGAMENWGLVVYKRSYIIPAVYNAERYKFGKYAIVHEFSHQWFGNLVTPEFWDYLWLSESFANYLQYHILDSIYPEWRPKELILSEVVQEALLYERERGAHPLNYQVECHGCYAPVHILYQKGCGIVRMMAYFLTEEAFRKGLNRYLLKSAFGNTVPADLYTALQEIISEEDANVLGNHTVADIMGTWDSLKGFPIVTVTRDYDARSITFHQKSMLGNDSSKWIIPVNYVSSTEAPFNFSKTTADIWLDEESLTQEFTKEGWIIVNKQQTGFYHVNYDVENWERIIEFLNSENFSSIHVLNRAQLISDSFVFASKEVIPWDIPLRLCEYLIREDDVIPLLSFYAVVKKYVYVHYYVNPDSPRLDIWRNYTLYNEVSAVGGNEYDVYKQYFDKILRHAYETLGRQATDGEELLTTLHRTRFLEVFTNIF